MIYRKGYCFGSSPRLRGTQSEQGAARLLKRFIPAPAGNAFLSQRMSSNLAVHPRACGERKCCTSPHCRCSGSSPRLRGTRELAAPRDDTHRFIPAPAGNAHERCALASPAAVHPRACGERVNLGVSLLLGGGSSPRLRGTPVHDMSPFSMLRFIPAPAGNAPPASENRLAPPVHPRACGERFWQQRRTTGASGSSPRLRGTRRRLARVSVAIRFIPAPAGNASALISSMSVKTVHPRACGERQRQK